MINSKAVEVKKVYSFPKLMIVEDSNGGAIILMTEVGASQGKGTVVHTFGQCRHKIGTFLCSWVMSEFRDYHGTVELSNDIQNDEVCGREA